MRENVDVASYVALVKPSKMLRLFGSITLAAVVALPLARAEAQVVVLTLVGGMIAAAGANALNMFADRDLDARGVRTALRPLPTGAIRPWQALAVGLGLVLTGTAILAVGCGENVAALVLAVVGTYAIGYGWLKRITPYYTLVGGAVWAAPILVVWLALDRPLSTKAIGAFVIAALWTTLHVWSSGLALVAGNTAAGPRFMPSTCKPQVTRFNVVALSCALAIVTVIAREWAMMPFDATLIGAAVIGLIIGRTGADRALSIAAMVFIAAFLGVTGAGAAGAI